MISPGSLTGGMFEDHRTPDATVNRTADPALNFVAVCGHHVQRVGFKINVSV